MSCGVGRRRGSDLALLWLWRRPAATAPKPLAWEPPYAVCAALEKDQKKRKKKKKRDKSTSLDVKVLAQRANTFLKLKYIFPSQHYKRVGL